MIRNSVTISTIKKLFARSGNICAFPKCNQTIVDDEDTIIGEICHIQAVSEKGARFNKNLTLEEINNFDNLVLLCRNHHKKVDDEKKYSVELLREIKGNHESKNKISEYNISDSIVLRVIEEFFNLDDLILKRKIADLKLNYSICRGTYHNHNGECIIKLYLKNFGNGAAKAPYFAIKYDGTVSIENFGFGLENFKSESIKWNIPFDQDGYVVYDANTNIIINPKTEILVAILKSKVDEYNSPAKDVFVYYKVNSENMEYKEDQLIIPYNELIKKH